MDTVVANLQDIANHFHGFDNTFPPFLQQGPSWMQPIVEFAVCVFEFAMAHTLMYVLIDHWGVVFEGCI